MKNHRRAFLKKAGMSISALGVISTRDVIASPWQPGVGNSSKMSAEERRRLIAQARFGRKRAATGKKGMAITSHPLASHAAIDALRQGGNACDAALSAAITQTVVEPHMTTITGVLSLL